MRQLVLDNSSGRFTFEFNVKSKRASYNMGVRPKYIHERRGTK